MNNYENITYDQIERNESKMMKQGLSVCQKFLLVLTLSTLIASNIAMALIINNQ